MISYNPPNMVTVHYKIKDIYDAKEFEDDEQSTEGNSETYFISAGTNGAQNRPLLVKTFHIRDHSICFYADSHNPMSTKCKMLIINVLNGESESTSDMYHWLLNFRNINIRPFGR